MNTITLVWKNITKQWETTALSLLLTAFGVAILSTIYISSDTFEKQLDNNSRNIDLVVGAKGSPLQLILSTVYHVDNPTGNISLEEANKIANNPLVQMAVPISLGDNYKGHRIIGTDTSYLSLYNLSLKNGKLWNKTFEIVIGSEVARKHKLTIGQQIHSVHGLSADAHAHDDHPMTIVGVLDHSNTVVDNLILSNLESVWDIHGIDHSEHDHSEHDHDNHHDHADHPENHNHDHDQNVAHDHDHNHDHVNESAHNHDAHSEDEHDHEHHHQEEELIDEKPQNETLIKNIGADLIKGQEVEITALLIQYNSPAAIAVIPRLINQSTHMQAASPAIESTRIFSLLGVGLDSLAILAYVIMLIAALSIFINLYNSLKVRKYDMAIMRTMGASKTKLFSLLIVEGVMITLFGGIIGLFLGHLTLYLISQQTSQSTDFINAFQLYPMEMWILIGAVILGIFAALIPAFKAYNTTISKTLASK